MKITILPAVTATCALILAGPVYAQHGQSTQAHAPKAPTTHGQSGGAATHGGTHATTTHGSSTHATTTHGSGTHATTTHGSGAHKSTAKTAGGPKTSTTTSTKSTSPTKTGKTTTTATTSTTTTPETQLTPLQQKLVKNTNLSAKLQSRLPDGVMVQDACVGFRNLGQFVAAVNVSNNLGIPFADLKAKMLGDTAHLTTTTTDDSSMSLGQAIHALRPTVDADGEALTATSQANATISGTTTTGTTATGTTTSKKK